MKVLGIDNGCQGYSHYEFEFEDLQVPGHTMYVDSPHVRQGDKLRADVRTIRYVVGKREGREEKKYPSSHVCQEARVHVRLTTIWAIMFMIHAQCAHKKLPNCSWPIKSQVSCRNFD